MAAPKRSLKENFSASNLVEDDPRAELLRISEIDLSDAEYRMFEQDALLALQRLQENLNNPAYDLTKR